MHVRRSAGDLAKSGSLEGAVIARVVGDGEAAFIGETAIAPGDAGVVELLVGEVRSEMACSAIAFAAKNLKAQLLLSGECRALAVDEAVVR